MASPDFTEGIGILAPLSQDSDPCAIIEFDHLVLPCAIIEFDHLVLAFFPHPCAKTAILTVICSKLTQLTLREGNNHSDSQAHSQAGFSMSWVARSWSSRRSMSERVGETALSPTARERPQHIFSNDFCVTFTNSITAVTPSDPEVPVIQDHVPATSSVLDFQKLDMIVLTRCGTAESLSRDKILRQERGQGKYPFSW